ncbi:MAG: c-type cytochrome [Chitinophagaceae bacterium]|nr:c-type cytochrome [Chitinophagaceae bacterium]
MRTSILTVAVTILSVTAILIGCDNTGDYSKKESEPVKLDSASMVRRGEYLVTVGVCDDCHSPKTMGPKGPEIDMERRLSGYPSSRPLPKFDTVMANKGITQFNEDFTAYAGPWGVSFSANLTGDATGAGSWPLQKFIYAIRNGKFKGDPNGRDLLPPMPWFNFKLMTDEDLASIHAYLKTLKPVENVPPAPKSFSQL